MRCSSGKFCYHPFKLFCLGKERSVLFVRPREKHEVLTTLITLVFVVNKLVRI